MTVVGAILLTAAGLLTGILGVKSLHDQAERGGRLIRLLELMSFELERFCTPLPQLFSALASKTDGVSAELCGRAAAAMAARDVRFRDAWMFACAILTEREREIILPLGDVLGQYGVSEQSAALAAALSDMRRYVGDLRDGMQEKSRLWLGLSAACGLLAAVILW